LVLPAAPVEHGEGTHGPGAAPAYRVIEKLPTGETFERFPGRAPVPVPPETGLGGALPTTSPAPWPAATPEVAPGPHSAATATPTPQQDHQPAGPDGGEHAEEHAEG